MQSQAYFIQKKGSPEEAFALRNFEIETPSENQVLIEVEGFGINYADVMARRGLYREAPPFPCVVGYEVVGKVIAVGEKVNAQLVGKRVLAFCRFGGYAKHVLTFDYAVAEVDSDAPITDLLALCTQAATAYYMAEYLSPIHSSDTVLIHAAAGGVGTILIQLAKRKGARIIAKVGQENKEALVKKLGADYVVNYNKSDYAKQIRNALNGDRIDISYNPVAGSTFKKDMELLGSGGRMVLFGGAELSGGKWGFFSQLSFLKKMGLILPIGLMMRSKNILGVNMLKIADNKPAVLSHCLKEVIQLYKNGEIHPQSGGTFDHSDLNRAHSLIESGKSVGKIAVKWS